MKTLTEFIVKKHLQKSYKYTPQNINELVGAIREEIAHDNYNLNCIDTSLITQMQGLFGSTIRLKASQEKKLDISGWNVSNVTNMCYMFDGCAYFNGDLSRWDVSKVTNMQGMFRDCMSFDSDISKWDTRAVTNMRSMFVGCYLFNLDLSKWNTSNTTDMTGMFSDCEKFSADLSLWNVTNVKNMKQMFYGCSSLKKKPKWYKPRS